MKIYQKLKRKGNLVLCFCILIISCSKNKNEQQKELQNNRNKIEVSDSTKTTIICKIDGFDYSPKRNFSIIYYDENYLFAGRDFGSADHPGGNTEAAFFVHSNDLDKWLKIMQITTKKGKFGYSQFSGKLTKEEERKMAYCAVDIGDRHHAGKDYCNLPLRSSGFISFPDKITLEKLPNEYVLEFNISWEIEAVKTILRFKKEDLDFAFDNEFEK